MLDPDRYRAAAARDPFCRTPVMVPRSVAIAVNILALAALTGVLLAGRVPPSIVGYFAIGLGVGIATCIPIGIANVIVIDAAYRHGPRRAVGAGLGGALADGVYASLGIFGIGPLLERHPAVPYALHAISGCVLLVYGVVLIRTRPAFAGTEDRPPGARGDGHLRDGFLVGVAATLLNPSAVVTWVVIVGGHATGVNRIEGTAWVLGIVLGTFAWFMVVTFLALRGRRVLRSQAARMTRVVAALVLVTGLYSLGRAVVPLLHAR